MQYTVVVDTLSLVAGGIIFAPILVWTSNNGPLIELIICKLVCMNLSHLDQIVDLYYTFITL